MPKEKYVPARCLSCRIYKRPECDVKVPRRNCRFFEPADDFAMEIALWERYRRENPTLFDLDSNSIVISHTPASENTPNQPDKVNGLR